MAEAPEESQSQRLCRAVRQVDQRGVSHTRGPARRGASASSRLRVPRTRPSREKPPGTRQPAPATTTSSAKAGRRRSAAGTPRRITQFLQSRGRMRGRPIKRTLRGQLSSTGPRRERVLPVQVDSRRPTSTSDSRSASCRIGACVQCAQSDDRAWSTRVVRDRSVTNLRVGSARCQFRFTQQRRVQAWACSFFSIGRALIVLPAFFSARRSS